MRTGAIFARGSCRALKWMALVGAVLALGAGQAAAQLQPPNNLMLEPTGGTDTTAELTLTWLPPNGTTSVYGYQYRIATIDAAFPDWTHAVRTLNTDGETTDAEGQLGPTIRSVTITGLTTTGRYKAEVRAVGAAPSTVAGDRGPVATANATAVTQPLVLEIDDDNSKPTNGGGIVAWDRPAAPGFTDVMGYEYRYIEGAVFPSGDLGESLWMPVDGDRTSTKVEITGLTNGKTYSVDVRAVAGATRKVKGVSLASADYYRLNPAGEPGAPEELTFKPASTGRSGTLSWKAAEDNGNPITRYEYRYYRDGVPRTTWEVVSGGGTALSVLVSGLDEDYINNYVFEARAVNGVGDGEIASTEDPTTPRPGEEPGRITKIEIVEVAGAEEKTIGGVERFHVDEGHIGKVKVTIEWTADQLRRIWRGLPAGISTPTPVEVTLDMMPHPVPNLAWVSEAETERGHDDVTIGPGLMVAIPKPPTDVNYRGTKTETGDTTIAFNDDLDAENEAFKITLLNGHHFHNTSIVESEDVYVIEDDETQGIDLEPVNKGDIYESGPPQVFKVVADPPREDLPLNVRFDLEDVTGETVASRDNTIDKAGGTIPIGRDGEETVTLTLDHNDENRTDDTITLSAEVVDYARDTGAFDETVARTKKEVEIPVIDVHKIPPFMVEVSISPVTEGENTTLTYTIDRNPPDTIAFDPETREYTSEALTLTVMAMDSSQNADFRIVAPEVTIPEHNGKAPWEQTVEVEVEIKPDDDLDVDEMLVLEATLEGTEDAANGRSDQSDPYASDMGAAARLKEATTARITIKDATTKLVEARPQAELDAAIKEVGADEMLTVDDMVTIMGSALFKSADGVTVIYSAMSSDMMVASATVSGGDIMVTAKGKGDAMITVEASATMASGVMANPQTEPDRASVEIPIAVALSPLTIELKGPDAGMNLVEGMEYTITAMANRAVEMDTMVELVQTDGTASPADYEVESITIMMGESMGTTTLMVKEDDMMENEGNMTEMLTLEGRIGAMKTTNSLMFYLWDAAVPALPIIAQLLLAAFLAVGGYRRYLRR